MPRNLGGLRMPESPGRIARLSGADNHQPVAVLKCAAWLARNNGIVGMASIQRLAAATKSSGLGKRHALARIGPRVFLRKGLRQFRGKAADLTITKGRGAA